MEPCSLGSLLKHRVSGLNIYRIHIFTCSTMEREQWAPMDFGEAFGCHSLKNDMGHFSVPSTENPTNNLDLFSLPQKIRKKKEAQACRSWNFVIIRKHIKTTKNGTTMKTQGLSSSLDEKDFAATWRARCTRSFLKP